MNNTAEHSPSTVSATESNPETVQCDACGERWPVELGACPTCYQPEPDENDDEIELDPCTDLKNAERLRDDTAGRLRHATGLGWLVYDGARFIQDNAAAARTMHRVARSILIEAAEADGRDEHEDLIAWAKRSQSRRGIVDAMTLAATLEGVACSVSEFDRDPMLLNVENGTIDLRTGEIRDHNPRDCLTKLAPVEFDAKAQCPTWLAFLDRIFDGKRDVIDFVQRAVGYTLTGAVTEQVLFLLHGSGANGKSTFLEALRHVLGDYATTTTADTLMMAKNGRGTENDLARLRGSRFVATVEVGEGRRLDEERVKRMTGGDTLTARFLYREHFEFAPTFKLWLGCNALPRVRGADHAIWRRIRLVPFQVTIPDSEQDRELPAKLRAEAPGILRWAVEGCLAWQRDGLAPPSEVVHATDEYRSDENMVSRFIEDCCEVDPKAETTSSDLYDRFTAWCEQAGEHAPSSREFGKRLGALGAFEARRGHGGVRRWRGLRVRERDPFADWAKKRAEKRSN